MCVVLGPFWNHVLLQETLKVGRIIKKILCEPYVGALDLRFWGLAALAVDL
jgi:hypothetical protein